METKYDEFRLTLGEAPDGLRAIPRKERGLQRILPARPNVDVQVVQKALLATPGVEELLEKVPGLDLPLAWLPVATFTVCLKTGTATFLDIWDADHFDGFTDLAENLSDCRVWFSADGFTFWDSPQTKTGRVNCYFKANTAGNYVCNAQLQSYAGPAVVECLIDNFSFGPLPFNGSINQPHPCVLSAGYHSFRIRQLTGSFFFISLTVWKV